MLKLNNLRKILGSAAMVAAGLGVSTLAEADVIFSWRTEDGTYAFTDSIKNVPARYKDSTEVRKMSGLSDYSRFPPQDALATTLYEDAVTARIASLESRRTRDAGLETPASPNAGRSVSLRTGGVNSPSIELVSTGPEAEPVVVETMFTRPSDSMATRRSMVVTQGDRILAIVKPRMRAWNVNEDIHIEDELGR